MGHEKGYVMNEVHKMRAGKTALALMLTSMLAACGSSGVFDRERPDEFAVSRQAPLVIPPDFALTPPRPGTAPTQQRAASEQALEVLFGGPAARSAIEQDALRRAGASDTSIRSTVGDSQTNTVDKGQVVRDVIAAPEGDGREAQAVTPE